MTIIRIINQQLRGNNTIIRVWYCVTICPQPAALGLIDCVDRCSISVLFLSLSLSLSLSLAFCMCVCVCQRRAHSNNKRHNKKKWGKKRGRCGAYVKRSLRTWMRGR